MDWDKLNILWDSVKKLSDEEFEIFSRIFQEKDGVSDENYMEMKENLAKSFRRN